MFFYNYSPFYPPLLIHLQLGFIIFLFLLNFHVTPLSFNFTSFDPSNQDIKCEGDAASLDSVLQLNKYEVEQTGHATYGELLHLWDKASGNLADFTTNFTFSIDSQYNEKYADGFAFFLAPPQFRIPDVQGGGGGGGLGLAYGNQTLNSTDNPFVAVEFDTYINIFDKEEAEHVGINVNSLVSSKSGRFFSNVMQGGMMNAQISYNSSSQNLCVYYTGVENSISYQRELCCEIDLREYLPEWVSFGFSAATGKYYEFHTIHSWSFIARLENDDIQPSSSPPNSHKKHGMPIWLLVVVCILSLSVIVFSIIIIFPLIVKKNERKQEDTIHVTEQEFETATGAKKISYEDLDRATNNFDEQAKLGEGGFSTVYKGFWSEKNLHVAVKKLNNVSIQGLQNYVSEVIITSKLNHQNLIKLIGWCHDREQLLLVFEYMPNLSLEHHLFNGSSLLKWVERYKILQGLASALHYLHQGCSRCVLHRDIKSSNVLLDSNFNAKLSDFGLARIVHHDAKSQTLEGWTNGYEAPECHQTGKSGKESDVFSFGVVALEIACGRRPFVQMEDGNQVRIVKWVWDHYEKGNLLDAADPRLTGEFDDNQMKRLMMLGLWCAHPRFSHRPSIGEALKVLNFEATPLSSHQNFLLLQFHQFHL
ncbi:hypothetical protein GH714_029074 [Hevea brasiliensis]|uniref:non-specific serine/threonine protein kinase n=1 Tax=Hevea brasiliensis TaxID=3981 RepID=A0A6A6N5B8_HEVBR|nr:hypothetical protein GH714_029074 [Hevea brasiliensis]